MLGSVSSSRLHGLDRGLEASLNARFVSFRRAVLRPPILALLLAALVPGPARPASAPAPPSWQEFPALYRLWIDGDAVRARSGADSIGQVQVVAFDAAANRWSRPVAAEPSARDSARLDQVLVFNGGLFDQFPATGQIDLGDGFVLARRDTGFALLDHGTDVGWPVVTWDELDKWGKEIRLGLPRDFPGDQLVMLKEQNRLKNVPGPYVRIGDTLWFGLAGGFAAAEGQLGGLVAYDTKTKSFRVVRHKFIVDVAVTRLIAVDGELWIGTGRFAPAWLEGLRGMLLHRPGRNEWRQFSPDNSRISGDLVYDAAAVGRHLWVTTNGGISRYDLDRKLWSSWYWRRASDGGFELGRDQPLEMPVGFE